MIDDIAFELAVALAFLSVIPEGNLLLFSAFAVAAAVLSVIPEGNLLLPAKPQIAPKHRAGKTPQSRIPKPL
ncbi:hypothetical protein [Acidicapsa ligni]|uniref:hypothetical protein n=1 Tax=Acidicapsa ligni TaxID=542300 RepID=UPI0021E0E519|nr:hypothetical protein [Acidicapsa ligni]